MFDFAGWIKVALPVAGMLVPLNMALVQWTGKLGASGKIQTIAAGITGLCLGFASGIAFFGVPSDFLGWFLNVLFGLMVFGGSVGTYEAIKHAAAKGAE
jgi:hypothetical protein